MNLKIILNNIYNIVKNNELNKNINDVVKKIYKIMYEDRENQKDIYFLTKEKAKKFVKFPGSGILVYNYKPEEIYFIDNIENIKYINDDIKLIKCYYSYNRDNVDKYGEIQFAETYKKAISKFGTEFKKGLIVRNNRKV